MAGIPPGYSEGAEKAGWKGLTMEERTECVEKYSPLIKYLADRLASRLPDHIIKDDLMSSGVLGLIDAIEKFEPDRGIMFKTYAEFRIKGSMLDELRNLDWVPRTVRKKASELDKLWLRLERELGRPPSDEESAAAMGIELKSYHKILDEVSVINMLDLEAFRMEAKSGERETLDIYEILEDENASDALTILGREELRLVLAEAIDALPEKERLVVTLYYHEELTMKEIGVVMRYTESRISQLHTKSIVRLRGRITRYFENKGKEPPPAPAKGKRGKSARAGGGAAPAAGAAAAEGAAGAGAGAHQAGAGAPEGAFGVRAPAGAAEVAAGAAQPGVRAPEGQAAVKAPEGAGAAQPGVRAPEGAAEVKAPEWQTGVRAPEGQAGVTAPEGASGVGAGEAQPGVRAPEGQAAVKAPEGAAEVKAPEWQTGVRAPEGQNGVKAAEGASGVGAGEAQTGLNAPEGPAGARASEGALATEGSGGKAGPESPDGSANKAGPEGPEG